MWDGTRIFETESNSRYGKYKESTHMARLTNLSSQPSLVISHLGLFYQRWGCQLREVTMTQ
jgi:hypothetical protein